MSRKFQYYNVVITLNNTATHLYFSEFLDKVNEIKWQKRLRKIKEHPTSLFEIVIPNEDKTCRIAAIGKYRQTVKPYTGDITQNIASMIKNDIIEMTTIVIAPQSRTILIESNLYGSKAKDIEEYFNSFFQLEDVRHQWGVKFLAVDSNRSLNDVRASNDIKELQLKFNVDNKDYDLMQRRIENQKTKNSVIESVLDVGKRIKKATDAPIVDLKFGKGRKRSIELDNNEIIKIINSLDIDQNDSVLSCNVTFKNPTNNKYEKLDLKNVGIKSDTVLEDDKNNHGWEFIGDKILEKYIGKGREGSILQRKIEYHNENKKLPPLSSTVDEKYLVKIKDGIREEGDQSA